MYGLESFLFVVFESRSGDMCVCVCVRSEIRHLRTVWRSGQTQRPSPITIVLRITSQLHTISQVCVFL